MVLSCRLAAVVALVLAFAGPVLAADPPAADGEKQVIDALAARNAQLKAALAGDVCADPDAARALLSQTVPPASDAAAAQPHADAAAVQPVDAANSRVLSRSQMVERLQKAVVLVIAAKDTGSGFFVTPDIVVTNNHVVDSSKSGEVIVVGRGLPGPRKARVLDRIAAAPGSNGRDYAILKVEGAQVSGFLPLSDTAGELEKVVAAGFPGLLLDNDMAFQALLRGDMAAMPELALSQGAVMALQNRDRGLMTIAHSAPISGGNSGGPLVDACARVLGINTFINVAVQQASSAGFALSAHDLIAYLTGKGIPVTRQNTPCQE